MEKKRSLLRNPYIRDMARYVRLRLEVEKVSASTAVECGLAVLEPSGIVHRRNNKGYETTHGVRVCAPDTET